MDGAVTITKAMWDAFDHSERTEKLMEPLELLHALDQKTHPLCGTPQAGRIPELKKQAEMQILQYLEWETEHEKNRTSN